MPTPRVLLVAGHGSGHLGSSEAAARRAPWGFVERLLTAYAGALASRGRREHPGWSSVPPPGWVLTDTVAAGALTVSQRGRLLRYRAS